MSIPVLISETFLDLSMWKRWLCPVYVRYKHLLVAPPSWYPCNGSCDEGWSQGHKWKFWQGCSTMGGGRAKARRAQCHVQGVPGVKYHLATKRPSASDVQLLSGYENARWFVKAELWLLRFPNIKRVCLQHLPPQPQVISCLMAEIIRQHHLGHYSRGYTAFTMDFSKVPTWKHSVL